MKRVPSDTELVSGSPAKHPRLLLKQHSEEEKTAGFMQIYFESLIPYERQRFVYAYRGIVQQLSSLGSREVSCHQSIVRQILQTLARSTLFRASCSCQFDSMQRRYDKTEAPRLYQEIGRLYRREYMQQIVRQAHQLQGAGVPRDRLIVVCANDNPRDKLGTLVSYERQFVGLLADQTFQRIDVPPIVYYECLDAKRVDQVCQHLDWTRYQVKQRYLELGLVRSKEDRFLADLLLGLFKLCDAIIDMAVK